MIMTPSADIPIDKSKICIISSCVIRAIKAFKTLSPIFTSYRVKPDTRGWCGFSHEVVYELTPMVSESPLSKYNSLGMDKNGQGDKAGA
eukprot:scaffold6260_cov79-Cyclotella_meneghiniana.AAC.2